VKNGTNPNNGVRLATAGSDVASHDFNGNRTALGPISYTWDPLNRLKTRSVAGTPYTYNFSYDAQDRRTAIDYQSTKFIYQGQNLVATSYRKAGGYYAANYLFGPRIDEPLARVDSTSVTYYSVDGLGSAILVSDDTGMVKNKYSYNSWGELKTGSETVVQPFRYTAREVAVLDPAGFIEKQFYYRARYFVPAIGRFVGEDLLSAFVRAATERIEGSPPLEPKVSSRFNQYLYVIDNPIHFTDPTGWDAIGCDSVPWYLENSRLLNCCYEHDKCYARNRCAASSWFTLWPSPCQQCNRRVACCASGLCSARPAPPDWVSRAHENDHPPIPPPPFSMPHFSNPRMGLPGGSIR
jgi:RHS repeat-associated protein